MCYRSFVRAVRFFHFSSFFIRIHFFALNFFLLVCVVFLLPVHYNLSNFFLAPYFPSAFSSCCVRVCVRTLLFEERRKQTGCKVKINGKRICYFVR